MPQPPQHFAPLQPRANVEPGAGGAIEAVLFAVEDVAALEALDDTTYVDGTVVAMRSLLDNWRLDRESTAVVDGITVVLPFSGSGRWVRDEVHNREWRLRATWYIDAAGDDENDGATALTALATHAELNRRVGFGPIYQSTTVNINSDLTEEIVVQAAPVDPFNAGWTYRGGRTVIYSGSVTGTTAYDPATNTPGDVIDAAIPVSWTASGLLNKLIVLTGGANSGAVAWVAADLGAKTARHSPFFLSFAIINPAITDTFDVVSTRTVTGSLSVRLPFGSLNVVDLVFTNPDSFAPFIITAGSPTVGVFYCDFFGGGGVVLGGAFADFIASQFRLDNDLSVEDGGLVQIDACLFTRMTTLRVSSAGSVNVGLPSIAQGGGGAVSPIVEGSGFFKLTDGAWFGIFDDAASGAGLRIRTSGTAALQDYLWGTGNTFAYGVRVDSGGTVTYTAAKPINIQTPATAETQIGGFNVAYAALPHVEGIRDAKIVIGQFF